MPRTINAPEPIVTHGLQSAALKVIEAARRDCRYPFLLDGKLGKANAKPMPDTQIASTYDTPRSSIGYKWANIIHALNEADHENGNPLGKIAQRSVEAMAKAAIINRHSRRPPLYSETTLETFVKLGLCTVEVLPLIRAAGYVNPPPIIEANHDIDFIIGDVAAHMARSHEPQGPEQILESLQHRKGALAQWPKLEMTLFVNRVADIRPNCQGLYHPDQPWGKFVSAQRLVASTMLRVLARNEQPATTSHLVDEIKRMVGHYLPDGYNTLNALRNFAYTSDEVSWQGLSTFGLAAWKADHAAPSTGHRRGRIGDHIHTFLVEHGPADMDEIIGHVQRVSDAKRRTIQEALNHDPRNRFVRIPDQRVAVNPIMARHEAGSPSLTVIQDEQEHEPTPVLRESELLWLTRYAQLINDLEPPLPSDVMVTGRRAAGFALDDPMEITVVVDDRDRPSLESQLAQAAAGASKAVPSVQPQISILSVEQWTERMDGETPLPHHNVWLAPDTTP